jgi:hypothetical protein
MQMKKDLSCLLKWQLNLLSEEKPLILLDKWEVDQG